MAYAIHASCRLRYDVRGDGPPVLYLHGLACGRRMWAGQLRRLASVCKGIALDFPGHAASDAPSDASLYSEASFALAALRVLDALGIGRAIVVGHSMGGGIAYEMAIRHPDRVAALCTVDAGSGSDDAATYRERTARMIALLVAEGIEGYVAALRTSALMAPYATRSPRASRHLALLLRQHDARGIERVIAGVNATRPATQDRTLERIACPTWIVNGLRDESCLRSGRIAATRIPGAKLVEVPGSGHMLPLEDPRAFDAVIREIVGAVGQPLIRG